jgi:hypothetical protein
LLPINVVNFLNEKEKKLKGDKQWVARSKKNIEL